MSSAFKTKPHVALDQIRAARAEGVPEGVVLAEAGYGITCAVGRRQCANSRHSLTAEVGPKRMLASPLASSLAILNHGEVVLDDG